MSFFHIIRYRMHLKGHNGMYDQGSKKKNRIPACPLGKQLPHFACIGPFLARLN